MVCLRKNSADAVIKAGGVPIFLPYQNETIDNMMDIIDGVILPGGLRMSTPNSMNLNMPRILVISNEEPDNFEILVLKKALEKNIPILGICRGMQLLNVVFGATLN